MEHENSPQYDGPLHQPRNGPTMFEVAERTFGRTFVSDTDLSKFLDSGDRDLQFNMALLAAGWKCRKKTRTKILLRTADRLYDAFIERLDESNRNTGLAY